MEDDQYWSQVGDVLRVTAAALRPWLLERVGDWPPDGRGRVEPRDPNYLIWVSLHHRPPVADRLGDDGRTLLHDLRHQRNRWAHHVSFDDLDAFRALDTCRRILIAVGAGGAASAVEQRLRALGHDGDRWPAAAAVPPPTPTRSPPAVAAAASGRPGRHRRMHSAEFRAEQWQHRFDPHVAPLNDLVDDLIEEREGSWMPYIPPYHGGIGSTVLSVFQDPGPMTSVDNDGSGFLGCENDDPSAQTFAECLDLAGASPLAITPWNAYPWYVPEQIPLTVANLEAGIDPLCRLLAVMPHAHSVVTHGAKAHDFWRRLHRASPAVARRYRHLETFHTSGRGITNGGQQTKLVGVAHVVATLKDALTYATDYK